LQAKSAGGGIATQRAWRVLGARLPRGVAFEALGFPANTRVQSARRSSATVADFVGPDVNLSACHRFTRARVDCEVQETDESGSGPFYCTRIAALVLGSSGLLDERDYRCPPGHDYPFKR